MVTNAEAVDIAVVVPRSGPAGIFGPSCETCAKLAAVEINAGGGVLGRELRLQVVDGGRSPRAVAAEVDRLVSDGRVQAVTGWHTSAARQKITPKTIGRVPYIYTALYEGGECNPGVFLTGETPERQVLPGLRWMADELGVRSWCIVGNDYVWPRISAMLTRRYAATVGCDIRDEVFVPLGTEEFGSTLRRVERSDAQGVLMFLLGMDAVRFNRAFTAMLMTDCCVRFSPLMEENMLLATGAANTHGLYAAAGFFETLPTAEGLDFGSRYVRRFGVNAPALNAAGESCFEGLALLEQLARQAGTLELPRMCAAADATALTYDGPRGVVSLHRNHLAQRIYLARAAGLEFDVITELHPVVERRCGPTHVL